jgi:hypothetical protein
VHQLVSRLAIIGFTAFTLSGCATYAAENRRLVDELERARAAVMDNRAHLAQLEQRLHDLERQREDDTERARVRELLPVMDKLDLLVSQTRELLLQSQPASVTTAPAASATVVGAGASEADSDPKEQLRHWAERLRGDPSRWRGGLSPAESQALNVLLRRERLLDPRNPWHGR